MRRLGGAEGQDKVRMRSYTRCLCGAASQPLDLHTCKQQQHLGPCGQVTGGSVSAVQPVGRCAGSGQRRGGCSPHPSRLFGEAALINRQREKKGSRGSDQKSWEQLRHSDAVSAGWAVPHGEPTPRGSPAQSTPALSRNKKQCNPVKLSYFSVTRDLEQRQRVS